MDGFATFEKKYDNLNWADLMDELMRETFEQQARTWARRPMYSKSKQQNLPAQQLPTATVPS